jgi:hypothetical protein
MLRELSDPSSLVSYPVPSPTSVDTSAPVSARSAVVVTRPTSHRGIYGAGLSDLTIFTPRVLQCPTPRVHTWVDVRTGEMCTEVKHYRYLGKWLPAPCRSNLCEPCSIRNARKIAGAIKLAEPSHTLGITQCGDKRKVSRFFADLAKTYPSLRYAYAIEEHPGGAGLHAHAFVHLDDSSVSQAVIDRSARRTGIGTVHLGTVEPGSRAVFFGYPFKDLADPGKRESFIAANGSGSPGGRTYLVHSSKSGFWRNGKGGKTCSRAHAESLSMARSR